MSLSNNIITRAIDYITLFLYVIIFCNPAQAKANESSFEEQKQAYMSTYLNNINNGFQATINAFDKFIINNPGNIYIPMAHDKIGTLNLGLTPINYQGSYDSFSLIIKNYPDHQLAPFAYYNLGRIAELTGKYSDAERWMTDLITKYPNSKAVNLANDFLAELANDNTTGKKMKKIQLEQERASAEATSNLVSKLKEASVALIKIQGEYSDARIGGASKADAYQAAAQAFNTQISSKIAEIDTSTSGCTATSVEVPANGSIPASPEITMLMGKVDISKFDNGCEHGSAAQ